VLAEAGVSDSFYVIVSGEVRVSQSGRVLRTEGPGEFFGEIGLLSGRAGQCSTTSWCAGSTREGDSPVVAFRRSACVMLTGSSDDGADLGIRLRTCSTCGTAGQPDSAKFCLECGSALAADPTCTSCGLALPPTGRFCPSCGAPRDATAAGPARDATQPRSTARKITSVLFGDLVGFTTISESRDAEEVRELLSAYFDECRAIVSRYGGELEKFIGDAVMAVWGLPVTREDDAERAVRAGLELVERVQALGERINVPGLNMRVGITTAEVAVTLGATGQGMVAGDPVNTAARIQSTAEPGQVWVDETTRNFSSSAIAFDDAGSHTMKGKAEPVPLWKVRAVVASAGGVRGDDLEGALVGRDRELRLIKEVFHRVEETLRPGLLVIDGEPGVGKSRLGWEFFKYIDGFDASVLWHRGRCLSYGEGVAYYALAEAVRGRLAIIAGSEDGELGSRETLQLAMADLVLDADERDWLQPRLAALLGLDSGGSFPREDLYVAWTDFFKYVGLWQSDRVQPVVIVIDDAQYADEGLLAFLEHLLAAADYPIFVLVLARPELLAEHPALVGNRRVTVVHLEPLSTPEMTTLLDGLVSGVPGAIREELVARAAGVPLYAIETVRSLIDQDLVVERNGRRVLADPDAVDLTALTAPASLQALIAARLDTLPPAERRVVDRASVLGLVFSDGGIAALCGDVTDLDQAVSALVRREVLRRDTDRLSADYGNYRFVQGAVRQVAYGMLSRRDRKATHLTVAAAFEAELAQGDGTGFELAPIIAQHYLDAIDAVPSDPDVPDLTRAASDHLERAADRAATLGAPAEAVRHLQMALQRCDADRRLAIQSKLARQLRISGDHGAATEHAAEALKGFEAEGDYLAAAAPAEDLALALVYGEGELARAESVVREQLDRLPDTRESLQARMALVTALAAVVLRKNDNAELKQLGELSLHLAEVSGDPRHIADSWITYALGALNDGLPKLAVTLMERAAELAGEHRALRVRGIALVNLAGYATFENVAVGVRSGREAVSTGRELGDAYLSAYAQANLAFALIHLGEWREALELASAEDARTFMQPESRAFRRIMALAREEEWTDGELEDGGRADDTDAAVDIERALAAHMSGSPEAVALAMQSARRGYADKVADEFWMVWLQASQIIRDHDDRGGLEELLGQVEDGTRPWPASVRTQRARLRAVVGAAGSMPPDDVEANFREALDTAGAWGSALFEAHVRADYGAWLTGQDRRAEGAELTRSAREFYERVGARRWLDALAQH
jgi:class 3 adenylate cyclase/predicted ATPase